jgi:hypothetical protein
MNFIVNKIDPPSPSYGVAGMFNERNVKLAALATLHVRCLVTRFL